MIERAGLTGNGVAACTCRLARDQLEIITAAAGTTPIGCADGFAGADNRAMRISNDPSSLNRQGYFELGGKDLNDLETNCFTCSSTSLIIFAGSRIFLVASAIQTS
jgi:hypothetical protein